MDVSILYLMDREYSRCYTDAGLYKKKEVEQIRSQIYWFLIDSDRIPWISHQSFAYWVEKREFMQKKNHLKCMFRFKIIDAAEEKKNTPMMMKMYTRWKAMKCRILFIAIPQFTCVFLHPLLFEFWPSQLNLYAVNILSSKAPFIYLLHYQSNADVFAIAFMTFHFIQFANPIKMDQHAICLCVLCTFSIMKIMFQEKTHTHTHTMCKLNKVSFWMRLIEHCRDLFRVSSKSTNLFQVEPGHWKMSTFSMSTTKNNCEPKMAFIHDILSKCRCNALKLRWKWMKKNGKKKKDENWSWWSRHHQIEFIPVWI